MKVGGFFNVKNNMIILTKGNNSTEIYVTPAENTTEVFIYFYFKFTNRITKSIVETYYEDTSTLNRYQKFDIDAAIFENEDTGFWTYEIRGYDYDTGEPVGDVLESGFMYLNPAQTFEPIKYDEQSNSFLTYNG